MNILVTGANGQLGNEMRIVTKDSADKYIFTDIVDASEESIAMLKKLAGDDINPDTELLDITDLTDIRIFVRKYSIDVIVNCAAYTNVDAAEDNERIAELLNAKAPENLAIAMKEVGGLLIHISTDYVFGGDPYNTPCKEDQIGTPTGVYGLTKLHGEHNIMNSGVDYLVFRTAWLYSEFGKNFMKTMLNLTATKPKLKVVFDQVGTPTYARDLADAILVALEDYKLFFKTKPSTLNYAKTGVYHFSNEGVCSWFDFTKMIQQIAVELETPETAETFGNHGVCEVFPCHSDEFPSLVKRPSFSVLDKLRVKNTFSLSIPFWVSSLKDCINHMIR